MGCGASTQAPATPSAPPLPAPPPAVNERGARAKAAEPVSKDAETAAAPRNIAGGKDNQGSEEGARLLCEEAVKGAMESLGEAHPHTQIFKRALASLG